MQLAALGAFLDPELVCFGKIPERFGIGIDARDGLVGGGPAGLIVISLPP